NGFAVFENLKLDKPKNGFTVGINDDVTNLSLPLDTNAPNTTPDGIVSCKFWGLGADGTVGANKNSIKIIGEHRKDDYAQAYFAYDSKKSGGVTVSHLRFGDKLIKSTYLVSKADFVACHNPSYVHKYEMVQDVKPGGTFLLNCAWDVNELTEHLPADMKQYIAKNNIKFYTIDGIGLAKEIGLGGRINMILQAAFFKLTGIIPIDKAIESMKKAVVDTYGKKGDKVIAMNHQAIDAGIANVKEVKVPAEWADAKDAPKEIVLDTDREDLLKFAKNIMIPANNQLGDRLPVSAFKGIEDGTFPQGLAALEKRGVAVDVPAWIPENCIQCGQCSLVCPHAAIRPYALSEDEIGKAPEGYKSKKMIGKGCENLKFAINVSVNDCLGCGVCITACPAKVKALQMQPIETQQGEQKNFDYAVKNVSDKELPFNVDSVKGSQFKKPLLEFSGACAGCGEPAYAKLITQLFGDRMYIANATGCSSIWGGSAPSTPYTVNKQGKGPAWANSLFEDNAEYGLGIYLGQKAIREKLIEKIRSLSCCDAERDEYLATLDDGKKNTEATKKLVEALEKCSCPDCAEILKEKDYLSKKSIWIFGGDGWAYDIGFGGLDHVIASGEDVNIFVFDTEVYSNTGGQASKSSQIGQVAQFAAAGKRTSKKELAQIAMSYGYAYVAQVGLGADYNQTVKAIAEAESYHGPSLVIGYAPCINHGLKGGMTNSQIEVKNAVAAGYWHTFRFDPRLKKDGKNPFQLDSKAPTTSYKDFIQNEVRYSSLERQFPEKAKELFENAEKAAAAKYDKLQKLSKLYE
ncbi:MAG: pyruvate:ferredoxin (flavodoxin) oxidoreductase, partial [Bacillota bacterium]|nr:pyruvate:ferredoxin (flavodoxin) oxidoreductase [Bacillota bacterium]